VVTQGNDGGTGDSEGPPGVGRLEEVIRASLDKVHEQAASPAELALVEILAEQIATNRRESEPDSGTDDHSATEHGNGDHGSEKGGG
jgi:hypothetical protein